MTNSLAAPVVAGLAVGIAFVVLVASIFSINYIEPIVYSHYAIAFQGLKDGYSAGEPIDFTVRVSGYGDHSCGYPNVSIKNADTGEIVWSAENFALVICPGGATQYDVTWMPKDWGTYPIVLGEGRYVVEAEFGEVIQQVIVVDADNGVDSTGTLTFGTEPHFGVRDSDERDKEG